MLHPVYINWPKKEDNHDQYYNSTVFKDIKKSIFWAATLQILTAFK